MRPSPRQRRRHHRRGEVARGTGRYRSGGESIPAPASVTATGPVYLATLATHRRWQLQADELLWGCVRGHPPQCPLCPNEVSPLKKRPVK
jgi:hypothetical protein